MAIKTPEGKWVVFEVSTGKQLERWPVDAKTLVADGTYSLTAPDGVEPKVDDGPPEHVGVPKTPVSTIPEAPVKRGPGRPRKEAAAE